MSDQPGTIRYVSWGEVLPWLLIPRALRLAISVPVLFMATIGVLLMPLGWSGASWLLPEQGRAAVVEDDQPQATPLSGNMSRSLSQPSVSLSIEASHFYAPMLSAAGSLVRPLREMLRPGIGWSELAYWTLGGVWNLLVWGLLGGTITRMAVMRYGRDEREGLVDACRFAGRRYLAFVGAPLFALLGVLVVLALSIPVGWVLQWNVGILLASLVWIFVLVGGVITTVLIIGLLLGWPLMWGALSAEEMGDVFESAQRTYAYIYGRPLHYAFYALLAIVVGSVTWHAATYLAESAVYFSLWAVTWAGESVSINTAGSGPAFIGLAIINGLNTLVLTVASAFRFSFLFTAAGVIYLLVRRDADQIELDNVYVAGRQTRYDLPPLTTDEAGVPVVEEE